MTDTTESDREPLAPSSAETSSAETPPPPGAGRRALSDRLPRAWMFPLLAFAATWIVIVATWNVAAALYGRMPWARYFWYEDSGFYGALARLGYHSASPAVPHSDPARAVFFPLYPWVIRAVMTVIGGHVVVAGLITQILVGAASAVAVWALASHVYGHRIADRAVLLYCAFPGAFVLGVMYSEPLAILLAATCLLATLKRKWLLAGLLALLAGAEHSTMVILTPLLGIVAVHAIWTRRDWRALVAPVLAPLGTLGFFAYVGPMFHNYFFFFRLERAGWKARMDFGAHELSVLTWNLPLAHKHPLLYGALAATFWIALIGIVLLVVARAPWPITLYTALVLIFCSISTADVRPRYGLTMFGIFLGYGAKLPTWLFWPALVVSAAAMAFLVGYYPTHLHHLHLPP